MNSLYTIEALDRWVGIMMTLSPVLLLAFRSVRRALGALCRWLMRPIIVRIESRDAVLGDMRESLSHIRESLAIVAGTLRMQADAAEDVGYFECDAEGRNVYVSSTYARWMGCSKDELLGWGFLTYTHPDDRDMVAREWERCRRQHTDYRARPRMGPPGGPYRTYDVILRPIPDAPPALAWTGMLRPVLEDAR